MAQEGKFPGLNPLLALVRNYECYYEVGGGGGVTQWSLYLLHTCGLPWYITLLCRQVIDGSLEPPSCRGLDVYHRFEIDGRCCGDVVGEGFLGKDFPWWLLTSVCDLATAIVCK